MENQEPKTENREIDPTRKALYDIDVECDDIARLASDQLSDNEIFKKLTPEHKEQIKSELGNLNEVYASLLQILEDIRGDQQ